MSQLKVASIRYRTEIAALKRSVSELERRFKLGDKARPVTKVVEESGQKQHRFSAKRLSAHRVRLGISAAQMGKLLGVSALSVYHWESGKIRPRARYLESISALSKLNKATAAAIVAAR